MPEPDEDCCNYMGISLLRSLSGAGIGRLQACLPLFPAGSHRVVLLRPAGLLMWLNSLTVNVLNIVYNKMLFKFIKHIINYNKRIMKNSI